MKKNSCAQRPGEKGRDRHRLALRAPDEARAVFDDEGQSEGHQQAVERIAAVKRADQNPLDREADDRGEQRRDQQRAPEADIGRDRIGDVSADDEKPAVGEIDHVAQVEDQRQAERHQRIECADDQPVGDVEEQKLRHRGLSRPLDLAARFAFGRRRLVAGDHVVDAEQSPRDRSRRAIAPRRRRPKSSTDDRRRGNSTCWVAA